MIVRTFFRMIWVVTAFIVAAATALAVLFALGAIWVGDESGPPRRTIRY